MTHDHATGWHIKKRQYTRATDDVTGQMLGDYAITLPDVMKVGRGLKDGDETAYSQGYDAWLCDGAVCASKIRI